MRRYFAFIAIFLFPQLNFGQTDTTVVPFVSYWSTGDSYDFRVTKIDRRWRGGELAKDDSSSYIANFEVLDSTDTDYTIKWSYETDFSKYEIPEEFAVKFNDYRMTEIIYRTSELGEFLEVVNWQEISAKMQGLFDDVTQDIMNEDPEHAKMANNVFQTFKQAYASKEGIEQLVVTELRLIHFPFGLEYSVEEPVRYEDELPNMFGGKPIRGDAMLYFQEVDFDEEYCVMIQERRLNPEDTRDMILNLLKKMKLGDKEMKKMLKEAQFDIVDYNIYAYYYYPGVPVLVETNRETIMDIGENKGKRVDITRVELM